MPKGKQGKEKTKKQDPIEATLWQAADKLRKNMDAAEYKHIVLGLIFLKYISDAFEDLHSKLLKGKDECEGADPEDPNEYTAEKVFFVPPVARWKSISANAKKTEILLANGKKVDIGGYVDEAMEAIERLNPSLKGVLPKVFARQNLDRASLGGLIDLIGTIALGSEEAKSKDVLGQVYEYFLGQFALAEGKKGGQFYTPRSVVRLLVEMLEPYEGRVFDPCCGSGGMFIQSEKFIKSHQDHYKKKGNGISLNPLDRISIYGQESNQTTWRLAKMNLAIRGIDSSNIKWNNEGSFLNDAHKDLKADFIIANPPFNDSDWSGELLKDDARWKNFGVPPAGNANYAWIQHFIYHMSSTKGMAGFVLAKGSLTSKTNSEGEIRKAIIEAGLLDCIVNLPAKLFLNTQIPACLWFIRRKGAEPSPRPSPNERGREHYRGGFDFSGQLKIARELRQKSTSAEHIFWEMVRDRRFLNLKFRRQHQIGEYIVDFYCDEQKLVIELDGAIHDTPQRQKIDHKRDGYLKTLGINVIRISNEKILNDTEGTLKMIASSLPSTSGRRAGDEGEVLFIDARNLGYLINRRTKNFTDEDIAKITETYHHWHNKTDGYEDVPGFCKSVSLDEIREKDYVLTPGRYIGLPEDEDDFDFVERFTKLKAELDEQMKEEVRLNELIRKNLSKLEIKG
jgi:type I restriction enzyme M protein